MFLENFLNINQHDKKIFRQLLSVIDEVPEKMETYVDLFYRNL